MKMSETNNEKTSNKPTFLSVASVKEFLLSRSGKCKYSELFSHFSDLILENDLGKFV